MTDTVTFPAGSVECVTVTVTCDVTLAAQPVSLSIDDGTTWLSCSWLGSSGNVRKARTDAPITFGPRGAYHEVLVKVVDTSEVPIMRAGRIGVG